MFLNDFNYISSDYSLLSADDSAILFLLNLVIKGFLFRLRATGFGFSLITSIICIIFSGISGMLDVLEKLLQVSRLDFGRLAIEPVIGCSKSRTLHYGELGASHVLTRTTAGCST